MPSLVLELQRAAQDTKTSVTDLLRMVKVIGAKLDLNDITEWVEHELGGYRGAISKLPDYRRVRGGEIEIRHPYRGWEHAGVIDACMPCFQPLSEVEQLATQTAVIRQLSHYENLPTDNILSSEWSQRIKVSGTRFIAITDAVRTKVLDWSLELEKRGIMGENMSFKEQERQAAAQNITIQNFKGVLGDVSHSHVEVHDYSTIHQTLRDHNVPQMERNEIENIMDDLKKATPAERPSLLERGKAWVVKNKEFLGASVVIVRKALGLPDTDA